MPYLTKKTAVTYIIFCSVKEKIYTLNFRRTMNTWYIYIYIFKVMYGLLLINNELNWVVT